MPYFAERQFALQPTQVLIDSRVTRLGRRPALQYRLLAPCDPDNSERRYRNTAHAKPPSRVFIRSLSRPQSGVALFPALAGRIKLGLGGLRIGILFDRAFSMRVAADRVPKPVVFSHILGMVDRLFVGPQPFRRKQREPYERKPNQCQANNDSD